RGTRIDGDFAERVVLVEHIDGAKLIEIEAVMGFKQALQNFGTKVNVFRANERADAGAIVTLLDLVPPALNLIAHHGGLVNKQHGARQQLEQVALSAGDGREKFPAGKDADTAGSRGFDGHVVVFVALFRLDALAAKTRMNSGEQMFRDGRFGQRKQLRFIESRLRTLRLGIEFANSFNFIAEELDTHGAVGLRRIDIENASAPRELTGHLDEVHLRVADAGQMRGKHFDVDFFAAAHADGEAGVVVAIEQLERHSLDRRNQNGDDAGSKLPQRGGALLLPVGAGRGRAGPPRGVDGAGEFAAGAQGGFQFLGGLVVSHHNDDGIFGGARHQRQIEGAGCRGKSRHTPTPRSEAEVPAYAIEGGGVLQLRENLADKREYHALPV